MGLVYAPAGLVFEVVVTGAQGLQVRCGGGAPVFPGDAVVEVGVAGVAAAAGESAGAVAVSHVPVEGGAGSVGVRAGVEELADRIGDQSPPGAVRVEGQRAGQRGGDGSVRRPSSPGWSSTASRVDRATVTVTTGRTGSFDRPRTRSTSVSARRWSAVRSSSPRECAALRWIRSRIAAAASAGRHAHRFVVPSSCGKNPTRRFATAARSSSVLSRRSKRATARLMIARNCGTVVSSARASA